MAQRGRPPDCADVLLKAHMMFLQTFAALVSARATSPTILVLEKLIPADVACDTVNVVSTALLHADEPFVVPVLLPSADVLLSNVHAPAPLPTVAVVSRDLLDSTSTAILHVNVDEPLVAPSLPPSADVLLSKKAPSVKAHPASEVLARPAPIVHVHWHGVSELGEEEETSLVFSVKRSRI